MYCTVADFVARFSLIELLQLADRDDAGEVDAAVEAVFAGRAADAKALIDSYLEQRYRERMPFATVPAALVTVSCDIVRYLLHTVSRPDEVAEPYKAAIKWLEHVAAGRAALDAGGTEPPKTGGLPVMVSDGRVFGRKDSEGFI